MIVVETMAAYHVDHTAIVHGWTLSQLLTGWLHQRNEQRRLRAEAVEASLRDADARALTGAMRRERVRHFESWRDYWRGVARTLRDPEWDEERPKLTHKQATWMLGRKQAAALKAKGTYSEIVEETEE